MSEKEMLPINDLKRLVDAAGSNVLDTAVRALASGWWLNGRETGAFCDEFASYVGVRYCTGVANGTDALEIALRALAEIRAKSKSEVVTVANAGGYSTIACRQLGLVPVYADIDEDSQLISLSSCVSSLGPETALVIATHLYGGVVDVVRLRTMMDDAGYAHIPILEDCAQAHGVRCAGKMAGSLGDISTFSFYPTKNLGAFGDAGAILTSDDELAARCQALRQYGWSSKYTVAVPGGRNSRMDEVQAAILRLLLRNLDQANQKRAEIMHRYDKAVPAGIRVVRAAEGTVAHLAVVLCPDRDALKAHLADAGVQTDVHYPILDCDQPGWRGLPQRFAPAGIPSSRASVERILTLPCFPTMRETEIERVCDALSGWAA